MAITIVASVFSAVASGANVTLVYAGAAENDIAVTFGGFAGGTATAPGVISPAGYTSIYSVDAADVDYKIEWKRLGATPDPSVLLAGSGDAADAGAYGAYVLRGVSTDANPFDITPIIQTSVATGVPDCPSVITSTNGAIVLAMAAADNFDSSPGVVTNFDANIGGSANDNDDITVAGAVSVLGTAGTLDPSAWSTWASGSYKAVTTVLKPFVANPVPATSFEFPGAYARIPKNLRNIISHP